MNLESDADEQLLIYIPFLQVIKLHSIVIKGPEEEGTSEFSELFACIEDDFPVVWAFMQSSIIFFSLYSFFFWLLELTKKWFFFCYTF